MEISIKSNIDAFIKDLDDLARTQIPYATALAINSLARLVVVGEKEEVLKDFPTATPFTQNGFSYIPATKNNQFATVFAKDIQETYLDPYTDGGQSIPTPGGAMRVPKGIGLNKFGNIPRGKIAALKGSGSVFVGSIKTKSGATIGGVFQRLKGAKGAQRLKILVRFTDPWSVKQHFAFEERARDTVEKNVQDALEQALMKALGSMR